MKKIFSFLLVCLVAFSLVGCFENEYVSNEGSLSLTLSSEYSEKMMYTAPSYTLEFEGVINTLANNKYSYYTSFTHNDDLVVSDLIANLFETHKDRMFVVTDDVKRGNKTRLNRMIDGKYKGGKVNVDDSTRYYETAYILLDNGLQLCVTYCRFVSNGETIYRFRETKNIELSLLYPLMLIKTSEEADPLFVCLPLPFLVTSRISGSSTKKAQEIYGNSDYIASKDHDVSFYVFDYPSIEDSKSFCINYYTNYFSATLVSEDNYSFTYNNIEFKLAFYENYFTVRPVNSAV